MAQSAHSVHSTKFWEAEQSRVPTLLEHYRILGIIGQGGMGTVFKGHHVNLKRDVAIKTLRIDKIGTHDLVNRFRQEMALIGQMDHPNVVRATDAGEKNGVFYLVMEFLSGADLGTLVARKGPMDVPQACELVRQAALGLDYIHQTLVHRDIKPSNLMLTTAGLVKILDLGLACSGLGDGGDRELTPDGCPIGTYSYMAPEQAGGRRQIDGRADIYSLGCTLFKLLTGKAPYSGAEYDNAARQLYGHCHVPLTAVEAFPQIPENIRPLLLRMTAKNPDERFPTSHDVARALAPFAAANRLTLLLDGAEEAVHSAVRPICDPAPEELSRLTMSAAETPLYSPAVMAASARSGPAPPKRTIAWLAGLMVLLGLSGLTWMIVPALLNRFRAEPELPPAAPAAEPSLRQLDELPAHQVHTLLDRTPIPIGCELFDPRKWHWDQGQQVVEAKGDNHLLFQLGTTSRSSFTFEAGVKQSPWTGQVGIFWGYHEDAAIKKAKTPLKDFAWFQLVCLYRDIGKNLETRYFVQRGRASLRYNASEEIGARIETLLAEPIILKTGAVILQIEVAGNRLKVARVGSDDLAAFRSPDADLMFRGDQWQGPLGLAAFSHAGVFSNARIIFHSNK